jgi:hypothetical protein
LARELQRARIGVEHFVFSKDGLVSHEFATTHFLSSTTGGALHFYNAYNADAYHNNKLRHGEHLYYSIFHTLTKACYYDVDFTCRASNGLTVLRFGAPDGLRETRDVGLSIVDSTSAFTVELDQEEKYFYLEADWRKMLEPSSNSHSCIPPATANAESELSPINSMFPLD